MKLVAALVVVLFVGCKGSSVDNVAAPSASPTTSASSTSPMASTIATASPPAAPDAAPAATAVVSTPPPPPSKCACPNVRVGGRYPQRSGHASPLPANEAQTVMSIDMTACTATVRNAFGSEHVEKCSSPLFAPPYINPAG